MRGDTEMTAQVVYAQVCFYIVWEGGYNGGTMGNVYPKMVYDSPSSFQDFSEHSQVFKTSYVYPTYL